MVNLHHPYIKLGAGHDEIKISDVLKKKKKRTQTYIMLKPTSHKG